MSATEEDERQVLLRRLASDFHSLGPTGTALAARALWERLDNSTYQGILKTRAHLSGWVGARSAGLWDTYVSDTVADATLAGLMDLLHGWAGECSELLPLAESPEPS